MITALALIIAAFAVLALALAPFAAALSDIVCTCPVLPIETPPAVRCEAVTVLASLALELDAFAFSVHLVNIYASERATV